MRQSITLNASSTWNNKKNTPHNRSTLPNIRIPMPASDTRPNFHAFLLLNQDDSDLSDERFFAESPAGGTSEPVDEVGVGIFAFRMSSVRLPVVDFRCDEYLAGEFNREISTPVSFNRDPLLGYARKSTDRQNTAVDE